MNVSRLLSLVAGFGLMASISAFALPKASDIYPKMGLGYNIGNTMEVPNDPTNWGNIVPNKTIIDGIKAAGFNTIRIPCAWYTHSTNGVIDETWLKTVKDVIDLAIANDMYVMLNSHWDNGWLEDNVFDGAHIDRNGQNSTTDAKAIAELQGKFWTQIANYFKSYDEHLIFASANEPGVNDHRGSGTAYTDNGQLGFGADRMNILKDYHEACLKAVRATGGNNETRTVIVQVPRTEHDKADLLSAQYPEDPAGAGYTMAEFHYYPYQLAFMPADESWGKVYYYWEDQTTGADAAHTCSGSATGSKSDIEKTFSKMQKLFSDKGIPVVIGEMGIAGHYTLSGSDLEMHQKARAAWYGYTVATAKKHGLVPVVWDTGFEGTFAKDENGSINVNNFTIIRRQAAYGSDLGSVVDKQVMNAMVTQFAAAEEYTPAQKIEVKEGDKALWVTYNTKISTASETGTVRLNFNGGADWSQYTAISFQLRTEPVSVIGCVGDSTKGCNGHAWTSVDAFGMSTAASSWSDFHLGAMEDFKSILNTVTIKLVDADGDKADGLKFKDKSKVTAFGINIYATQLQGTMYLNNIVLIKADGTCDTLQSFDADLPDTDGIAKVQLIDANADGTGPEFVAGIKAVAAVNSKMFVNVQQGYVNATFTAAKAGEASAKLINGLGQVIASQNFTAHAGANTVQLTTGYRGAAMLLVKQGSQKFMQKVILK